MQYVWQQHGDATELQRAQASAWAWDGAFGEGIQGR